MRQPLTGPYGWTEAKGENLPVDEKLVDAIPGKARAVIRSMDPRGTVNFFARAWREKPEEALHECHVIVVAFRQANLPRIDVGYRGLNALPAALDTNADVGCHNRRTAARFEGYRRRSAATGSRSSRWRRWIGRTPPVNHSSSAESCPSIHRRRAPRSPSAWRSFVRGSMGTESRRPRI